MGDGIRQQTIVHLLRKSSAGNRSNFRRPSRWNRIIGNLHYSEGGGWRGAIERHVIREFFDRGFGVGCCQVFVERLEEQVQVKSRFVALKLLKCSCDDGSGKAGLIPNEGVGLAGHRTGAGPLGGSSIADALFSASDHRHVRRYGDVHRGGEAVNPVCVHREPAASVEQVARIVVNRGQLQPLHGTLISGIELSLVIEGQSGRTVLRQPIRQLHAHRRVLGNALGAERLAALIEHLVDPQTIVQLKRCNVQILQRGELYLRLGGEFVAVWR